MKLHGADGSPYVRKVLVTAAEAGLDGEIERVIPSVSVWVGAGDAGVANANPIGKVPVLTTRDGETLIDSSLICEYLAGLAPECGLLPIDGPERWRMLNFQALAQGLMDAMIFRLLETQVRPDDKRWDEWIERQSIKIDRTLDYFDTGVLAEAANLGTISLACAVGILEQRVGDSSWRNGRPALADWFDVFSQRASMRASEPPPLPPPDQDPRKSN